MIASAMFKILCFFILSFPLFLYILEPKQHLNFSRMGFGRISKQTEQHILNWEDYNNNPRLFQAFFCQLSTENWFLLYWAGTSLAVLLMISECGMDLASSDAAEMERCRLHFRLAWDGENRGIDRWAHRSMWLPPAVTITHSNLSMLIKINPCLWQRFVFMAEMERFELSKSFWPLHDFQSCALDQLRDISVWSSAVPVHLSAWTL